MCGRQHHDRSRYLRPTDSHPDTNTHSNVNTNAHANTPVPIAPAWPLVEALRSQSERTVETSQYQHTSLLRNKWRHRDRGVRSRYQRAGDDRVIVRAPAPA